MADESGALGGNFYRADGNLRALLGAQRALA